MTVAQLVEVARSSGRTLEDVVLLWGERVGVLMKSSKLSRTDAAECALVDVSTQLLRETR
jgi:hypothetical protein